MPSSDKICKSLKLLRSSWYVYIVKGNGGGGRGKGKWQVDIHVLLCTIVTALSSVLPAKGAHILHFF